MKDVAAMDSSWYRASQTEPTGIERFREKTNLALVEWQHPYRVAVQHNHCKEKNMIHNEVCVTSCLKLQSLRASTSDPTILSPVHYVEPSPRCDSSWYEREPRATKSITCRSYRLVG